MGEKKKHQDSFPFPDRSLAFQELERDPCFSKIPEEDYQKIIDLAWQTGTDAAETVYREQNGSYDFFAICKNSGLKIVEKQVDFVAGQQRYFSDYISGRNLINLYLGSIKLWAEQNHMTVKKAENLILSHEYFHYLEWNRIGLTSRKYQVPMIRIGSFHIGSTGIRALSEIGAHAFARTYHDLNAADSHKKNTT
jgi:hypothetical protein